MPKRGMAKGGSEATEPASRQRKEKESQFGTGLAGEGGAAGRAIVIVVHESGDPKTVPHQQCRAG